MAGEEEVVALAPADTAARQPAPIPPSGAAVQAPPAAPPLGARSSSNEIVTRRRRRFVGGGSLEAERRWETMADAYGKLVRLRLAEAPADEALAAYRAARRDLTDLVGEPTHRYFAEGLPAAVVETAEPNLYIYLDNFDNPALSRVRSLLDSVLELNKLSMDCLRGEDRRTSVCELSGLAGDAVGLLDHIELEKRAGRPVGEPYVDDEMKRMASCVSRARRRVRSYCRRASQFVYTSWMAISVGMTLLVTLGLFFLLTLADEQDWGAQLALAAVGGAFGGALSGVTMIQKATHIAFDAGHASFRLFGFLRPIVGACLGVAMYVVLAGGFIPSQVRASGDEALWALAIGVLFGFAQAVAVDALNRVAGAVVQEPE